MTPINKANRSLILKARIVQLKEALKGAIASGSHQRIAELKRALKENEHEYKELIHNS